MLSKDGFEKSFLARVPALIERGLTPDAAIEKAFQDEQDLILELMYEKSDRAKKAKEIMTIHVQGELRAKAAREESLQRINQTFDNWNWEEIRNIKLI